MVPERKEKEFIPSKKFIGAKKGYVFKKFLRFFEVS